MVWHAETRRIDACCEPPPSFLPCGAQHFEPHPVAIAGEVACVAQRSRPEGGMTKRWDGGAPLRLAATLLLRGSAPPPLFHQCAEVQSVLRRGGKFWTK
jgi:hypothetical protein